MYHIKVHCVQMTSLQSQYMLCPSLACNTARTRLYQSTKTVLRNSLSFLLKGLLQFLQSLRCWLTTCARVDPSHPQMFYWFKSSDLNGQGCTVTFWLTRKSTVARVVCDRVLSCRKTSLRRFIAGSMCGVKTSSLYRAALRLPWMCTS